MNANGTNRNDEPARRRWLSADRLLLGAILALQVLILCRLRPADGARGSSVADDSSVKPAAKNETLRRGDASELSVARAQSPKPGDPAGQVANPAVALLPPAFPAAAQPLRSWPDEAALSLLEAARLEHCMDDMLAQAMSEFERMSPFINLAEAWQALSSRVSCLLYTSPSPRD